MRKKSSYSEESVLLTGNSKLSDYLRQNPRLPKKMKPKAKCVNPTVRTVGQLSSGSKRLTNNIFGTEDVSIEEPVRGEANPTNHTKDMSWSILNTPLYNNQSPRCPSRPLLVVDDNIFNQKSWPTREENNTPFRRVVPETECLRELTESENNTESKPPMLNMPTMGQVISPNRKTSDNGVQVNMFHCKECRRHIKYGKNFQFETSCTESDSESNLFALTCCSTCKRNESQVILDKEIGGLENYEGGDCPLNRSPRDHNDTPHYNYSLTPRSEVSSKDGEIKQTDNLSQLLKVTQMIGGKKISDIKFVTAAILTVSTILYFTQIENFGATISTVVFYVRNMIVQQEIEERFSVFDWVSYIFLSVQENVKPQPLFLYFF